MKKVIFAAVILILIIGSVVALGDTVNNRGEAYELLQEYAENEKLYSWANSAYDPETKTQFDLLTLSKKVLREEYNYNFDDGLEGFIKLYENEYKTKMGIVVSISSHIIDLYKGNYIYELIITSENNIAHPEYGEIINIAKVIFITY